MLPLITDADKNKVVRQIEWNQQFEAAEDKLVFLLNEVKKAEDALIAKVGQENYKAYKVALSRPMSNEEWIVFIQQKLGHAFPEYKWNWKMINAVFDYAQGTPIEAEDMKND